MEIVSLTSEGKILLALKHGKHTYSELRLETGLSDRWLATKLKELKEAQRIDRRAGWYGLRNKLNVSSYELSLYMRNQARRMACELAKLHQVKTIILFGGVAQGNAHEYSDLDLMVVVSDSDEARRRILAEVSELESKYHITIEPLILRREDFLDNIHSHEGGITYGIAEGYEVLIDKTGELAEILHNRVEEIRRSHDYLAEERIWIKAR